MLDLTTLSHPFQMWCQGLVDELADLPEPIVTQDTFKLEDFKPGMRAESFMQRFRKGYPTDSGSLYEFKVYGRRRVREEFVRIYGSDELRAKIGRPVPPINDPYANSLSLYCGKSGGGPRARFQQHLGTFESGRTGALQLLHYLPYHRYPQNVVLEFTCYTYPGLSYEGLILLELWYHDQCRPILGKRGGNR